MLASRSPRRLELAIGEGWQVTVAAPPESAEASEPPRGPNESLADYVTRLARAKAEAVAATGVSGVLVACDTLSEVDGVALGQPADAADARRMLASLSGRRHRVLTGVCVWRIPDGQPRFAVSESLLEMGPLSEEFLDWYLASGLWEGKAGACGFQDERLPLALVAGSQEAAADAVQEAFVKAHLHWRRVQRYDDPVGWIRRVAINKLRDESRRQGRKDKAVQRMQGEIRDDGVEWSDGADAGALLAGLPRQQRLAMALFYVEGLSVAEVAAALEISDGAVRFHLHQGRARLRGLVEETKETPR